MRGEAMISAVCQSAPLPCEIPCSADGSPTAASSYTFMNYTLEHYFFLVPNQLIVNNSPFKNIVR